MWMESFHAGFHTRSERILEQLWEGEVWIGILTSGALGRLIFLGKVTFLAHFSLSTGSPLRGDNIAAVFSYPKQSLVPSNVFFLYAR